ncbi:MAG TPA: ABC transporter permease [Baekduia sp.]|uniref:ABC transporter permease n=1 Tax=Baekduia sp. TaxID=2600305 RepID=UPI002D770D82|nr:ABC transporter permease [Baekduia sp.]HET6509867.1 ABC transporter permease [Baekduia sp.]
MTRRARRADRARRHAPRPLGARIGLGLSLLVLAVAVVAALFPGLVAPHDPYEIFQGHNLEAPSGAHLFGTDNLGRDLFSRVVHGAHVSLVAALVALGISFTGGTLLGLLSGSGGRVVDATLMRATDLMMSIPSLMLSLAVVAALGFGTINVAIAVGVAGIAAVTRLMRSSVLVVARSAYVEAAALSGASRTSALVRHVLPNAFTPVAAYVALDFGASIIAISSLSFLGLGVKPPQPEWGSLVAEGRSFLDTAWWLTTLPGLVVTAVVVAANGVFLYFQGATRAAA